MYCRNSAYFLSEAGNVVIPPPAQKTFDAEGEALEHALAKSLRIRNEARATSTLPRQLSAGE